MTRKRKHAERHAVPIARMRRPATGGSRCQTIKPRAGGSSSATKYQLLRPKDQLRHEGPSATSRTSFYAFGVRLRCATEKRAEYQRVLKEARGRKLIWSAREWRKAVERVKQNSDWGITSHGGDRKGSVTQASDGPTSKPTIGSWGHEEVRDVGHGVENAYALGFRLVGKKLVCGSCGNGFPVSDVEERINASRGWWARNACP